MAICLAWRAERRPWMTAFGRSSTARKRGPATKIETGEFTARTRASATSFRYFVSATLAEIIPGTVIYVYLGALGKAAANGGVSVGTLKWVLSGTGPLATLVVVFLVTRTAMAKLKEAG